MGNAMSQLPARMVNEMDKLKPCGKNVPHKRYGIEKSNPRLYRIWKFMRYRCERSSRKEYKNYGGRGISVCEEWEDPLSFCKWSLENGYADGLQIDRINNDGNYNPSNCRWVTIKQNARNRRDTVTLTVDGVTHAAVEWAELLGINAVTLRWWINTYGADRAIQKVRMVISSDGTAK